jgi:hypothetical protein
MPADRWVLTYAYGPGSEVTVDAGPEQRAREAFEDRKNALPPTPGAFVRLTCNGKLVDEWQPETATSALPQLAPATLRGLQRLAAYAMIAPAGTFGEAHLEVLAACVWVRQAGLYLAGESEARP